MYRFGAVDPAVGLKESACQLALDQQPQAHYVFCAVQDWIDADMKGEATKIRQLWAEGMFWLLPDQYVPPGTLHAIDKPADAWSPPEFKYTHAMVRRP